MFKFVDIPKKFEINKKIKKFKRDYEKINFDFKNIKLSLENISYFIIKNELIFDNVNFELKSREVYAILGPSDLGKQL